MEKAMYQQMGRHEDSHWWFAGRRSIVKALLDRFFTEPENRRVLEIGCGTGGNLELLSQYGHLTAIELYDDAIALAAQRNVCPILKGSLPDQLPISGRFDLICLLDVLEHVDEDSASLAKLKELLSDHGLLLITVPAYKFLWSSHDEIHHHKRRYTRRQLKKLIAQNGMTATYSSYFNTLLFPLAYLVRLVNKLAQHKESYGVELPVQWLNRLLLRIFRLEIPLLKCIALPFGVSIIVIAQKNQAS